MKTPAVFDHDDLALDTCDSPGHKRLSVDRFRRNDLGHTARKPTVIVQMTKWPVQPRRGHLQRVGMVNGILDRIARSHLVSESTALVWEQSSRNEAPEELGQLSLAWNRRYGDTQVSVYWSQSRLPAG